MKPNFRDAAVAIILGGASLAMAIPVYAQSEAPAAPPAAADTAPQGLAAPFARFDTDGDGKVTEAEIQASRAARAAELDADGDGKISLEELVAQEMRDAQARIEARVKARIAAQDSDGDGMLSAAELAARPMPDRMFQRMDADGDGAVSAEEMQARRDMMRAQGRDGRKDARFGRHHGGKDGKGRFNCDGMPGRGGRN